jgi:cytoskeletal protein CcmA (bactofilin family)
MSVQRTRCAAPRADGGDDRPHAEHTSPQFVCADRRNGIRAPCFRGDAQGVGVIAAQQQEGLHMFGRRKGSDGTAKTGSVTPASTPAIESGGPRMYRADSALAPDVTATTGRRADVRSSAPGDAESKKLVVGREIALAGEIRGCNRLIVEGRVEAALSDSRSIEVSATGVFKGKAQIESAEISGRFEGDLVVTQKLVISSTGRVHGNIRYGEIEIARGGTISGQIEAIHGGGPEPVSVTPATASGSVSASVSESTTQN